MFRILRIAAIVVVAIMPVSSHAFDVVPGVSVIELPANRSGVTITIRNPRATELPVTAEVMERFVEEDGSERHEPADDLFVVFPPQAVIPPGKTQAIRVQWLGEPPAKSRSFHLYASEVPVALEAGDASVLQRVLRVGVSVHVAGAESQPGPVVAASVPGDGNVLVTLANEGERFFYIDSVGLDFGRKHVTGADLAKAAGRTLVPPGARRTFTVEGVTGTPVLAKP